MVQAVASEEVMRKEVQETTISSLQASQLKEEISKLMQEVSNESAMKLTTELKIKLKDTDATEMQQMMVEMKVFDLIMQTHNLTKEDVHSLFMKYGLKMEPIAIPISQAV